MKVGTQVFSQSDAAYDR